MSPCCYPALMWVKNRANTAVPCLEWSSSSAAPFLACFTGNPGKTRALINRKRPSSHGMIRQTTSGSSFGRHGMRNGWVSRPTTSRTGWMGARRRGACLSRHGLVTNAPTRSSSPCRISSTCRISPTNVAGKSISITSFSMTNHRTRRRSWCPGRSRFDFIHILKISSKNLP